MLILGFNNSYSLVSLSVVCRLQLTGKDDCLRC